MADFKHIVDFLVESPFFLGMTTGQLTLLAGCGKLARFKEGELLAQEGMPANDFYLIREGEVAIEIHAPGGTMMVSKAGPEGLVGFSWLFPPYRNCFDARAVTAVAAVSFDGACLRKKAEDDHELGYQLMKRFAEILLRRMQDTRLQMLDIYGQGGRGAA